MNDIEVPILRNDAETLKERMTENAYDQILPARYLLKNADGEIIEEQEELFERVAKNIAVAEGVFEQEIPEKYAPNLHYDDPRFNEETRETMKMWKDVFQEHMEQLKFIPNTPTLINAGTDMQQLSACFVLSPEDDMSDIHEKAHDAAMIFQSGGGCGYDFSRLRPYGDSVQSTGGIASGPLTFMNTFDQVCETVAQGGVRRGAQMGTMRVDHPDVIYFLHAKNKDVSLAQTLRLNDPDDPTYTDFGSAIEEARELVEDDKVPKHLRNAAEGHLSNFNISVLVTDEFMEALQNDEDFTMINPRTDEPHIVTPETKEMYEWFGIDVEVGEELSVPASEIWHSMVEGAYENGEPGVIYIDTVNDDHSYDIEEHPEYEQLTTNPCAEQPLMEYEACNLGHINLSTIVDEDRELWGSASEGWDLDYTETAVSQFLDQAIDWEELSKRVEVGTRFLDNVVTMSDFPVDEISETVRKNRKIGLGIMGLAQLFIQLGVEYGSPEANEIAGQIMKYINHQSKRESYYLSQDRGVFENWHHSKYESPTQYPEWFEQHVGLEPSDYADGFPIRNHNTTTVAPTGTTSMIANTTGGCEPMFNVAYYKNVTDDIQGDEMLVEFDSLFLKVLEVNDIDVDAVKEETQELMENNEFDGVQDLDTVPDEIAKLFVVTSDLNAKEHASVMCAVQEGVDSSISKTMNAHKDSTIVDAKEVFEYIFENGGKSVTYYRDGSRSKQVLTTDNLQSDDEDDSPSRVVSERPKRTKGETIQVQTGYGNLYVTINENEGRPIEVFATVSKSGSLTESFTEAIGRQASLALRAGVNIEDVIEQLRGIQSPKMTWDDGEEVLSIPDGIARALELYALSEDNDVDIDLDDVQMADVCPECGTEVRFSEGCEECHTCGWSKC